MNLNELTPGMQIAGIYTRTVRTVESVDDEHVCVSYTDKHGFAVRDYIRTCDILSYWQPYGGGRRRKV